MDYVTRKKFLKQIAVLGVSPFLIPPLDFSIKKKKIKVALQLVSIIPACKKDLPGTFKQLANMGYHGVEISTRFGGFYGRTPAEFKKILNDCGLLCVGMHPSAAELEKELPKLIETAHILETKSLVHAELPVGKNEIKSRDAWLKAADLFNNLSGKLSKEDLFVGYHNHTEEWIRFENTNGWEILFNNTDKKVIHQIDTAHCLAGGGDLVGMINKFKGRTKSIHLKERGIKDFGIGEPAFGEGKCPWEKVFDACEKNGGTEWYIIERYMGRTADNNEDMVGAKQYIDFMKAQKKV